MNFKGVVSTILLLFVGVCIVFVVLRESGVGDGTDPAKPAASEAILDEPPAGAIAAVEPEVIAYYFHGQMRCRKCIAIEEYTHEALETGFAEDWQSGRLQWRKVNTEEPGNGHFVTDYEITTSSVVLVAMEDGAPSRWKKLDRVWELVNDYLAFGAYVQDEARAFMEEGA